MNPTLSEKKSPDIAYRYRDALYLNVTSRCPTACEFCIKFSWDYRYRGYNLLLKKEPAIQEILDCARDPQTYSEIVFCGYGESTYRLSDMESVANTLRQKGAKKIRLNTIGLGNLIHGRSIAADLARFLDEVSISLNTADPNEWVQMHRPLPEFKEKGFESVLQFIRECAQIIPKTFVTAVERKGSNLSQFTSLVESLGARVRLRPYLDDYEDQ
ncbi:MAG: radical SAM protein [Elusimicrobia bacterium]|nr:radical SAM protein [Elusimicrobiota bacterium]